MALVPAAAGGDMVGDAQQHPPANPPCARAAWLGQEPVRAAQRVWRSSRPSPSLLGSSVWPFIICLSVPRYNHHPSWFGHSAGNCDFDRFVL